MEIKQMNIYEKLSAIRDEAGVIAKNLSIDVTNSRSYKAVSERDVLDTIRPLMSKYGIYCYPMCRELDDKAQIVTSSKYGDRTNFYFHYKNVMRFVNIHKPEEFIDVVSYSTGIDAGDKADGKAMTYGDKYALLKTFMISTGEDADQEASQEYKKKIGDHEWQDLKKMYSKEQIKEMYKELGISKGNDIPFEYYEKKKAEWDKKFVEEHPEKPFY